ncbi:MAG: hypothetical protein M5U12_18160 [Verrucomicrobia bacterium]|nr:hypothetical protein [Verrucomicrobiota bacterium]
MSSKALADPQGAIAGGAGSYRLRTLLSDLRSEIKTSGGGNLLGILVTVLFSSRFHLIALYRIARYASLNRLNPLCVPLKWLQFVLTASEISPHALVGLRVRFPHPTGIVIGEGVVIEDEAWVFQQVTLGSHGRSAERKEYPVVGRGARLYAGVRVIGGVRVGEMATVGANAVVLDSIPDGATAVGVPARVLKK